TPSPYTPLFGSPARTYNVGAIHAAARSDEAIHICEGELDAVILSKLGLHAIAIPGAAGWNPRHRRMLAGFNDVFVWPDRDEAGDKFAAAVMRSLYAALRVKLPYGDVKIGRAHV